MLSRKIRKVLFTIIGALLFVFGIYFIDHCKRNNREEKLKNTTQTWGIYVGEVVGIGFTGFNYKYLNKKGKEFVFVDKRNFMHIKKGDTVLIKYSVEDPSVAEVIDFCYMQKHKGKDYCNE